MLTASMVMARGLGWDGIFRYSKLLAGLRFPL